MILAGDIGGTKTSLGLFSTKEGRLVPSHLKTFSSRDYPDFSELITLFLKNQCGTIDQACFGVAGPIIQGTCSATNLPWRIDSTQIAQGFNIEKVSLLNDLEAMAYGTLGLANEDLASLNPVENPLKENRAIIAAGSGLGEAVLYWDGVTYHASASEGGHTDFAPRNAIEIALLEYLLKKYTHVSYERLLSGPGLYAIYQFLKTRGQENESEWLEERFKKEDPAAVISEAALAEASELCVCSLDLFASIYGAEAGNLALKALASGGIYVGGGIAPKILNKLKDGSFMKAFLDKGRFSSLLAKIPVWVILDHQSALYGAARYAMSENMT